MTNSNTNALSELPFYDLTQKQLLQTTGSWVFSSSNNIINSRDLFQDIIVSPDSESNLENFAHDFTDQSKYYDIKQTSNILNQNNSSHGFTIMHFNMRSLPKNLSLLEDLLVTFKSPPEIIAISETKLNNENIYNIDIPNYAFINTNSKTASGGVGIYISKEIKFTVRHDLACSNASFESCWIEIICQKQKNTIIGCIYRHPSSDCAEFCEAVVFSNL